MNLAQALIYDAQSGCWLQFTRPRRILSADCIDQVGDVLRSVEAAVEKEQLWAVGFISYEAGGAFEPAIRHTADPHGFPLAWFALCDEPEPLVDLPDPARPVPPPDWRADIGEAEYCRAVDRVRNLIRDGDTYQVNFSYRLHAPFAGCPRDLFLALAAADRPRFGAYLDTGDWAVASLSPECFFRLDGEQIDSIPMKGTAPRGLWFADDSRCADQLTHSEKDRAENVMIVDMVRNDLHRICRPGSVHVPRLFAAERHATVWQMTSTVRGQTRAPLDEIFAALFPPASVTGAPKIRTTQIIADLEPSPRRIYTGAVGFLKPGRRARFNVAIRTILFDRRRNRAEYGVGSGLVWDSRPDREWAECGVKQRVLTARPGRFDLLETMLWTAAEGATLLDYHLKRLRESAIYFDFAFDEARIRAALDRAAADLAEPHRIRLLLSRPGAVRIETAPFAPEPGREVTVALAAAPVDPSDPFLYHKTTRRDVYERARAAHPEADDVLLYNDRGEATESTIANLAAEIDGRLVTPPIRCGLLPGTYRAYMLDTGQLTERPIPLEDLSRATRLYLMNSVRALYRIRLTESHSISRPGGKFRHDAGR